MTCLWRYVKIDSYLNTPTNHSDPPQTAEVFNLLDWATVGSNPARLSNLSSPPPHRGHFASWDQSPWYDHNKAQTDLATCCFHGNGWTDQGTVTCALLKSLACVNFRSVGWLIMAMHYITFKFQIQKCLLRISAWELLYADSFQLRNLKLWNFRITKV